MKKLLITVNGKKYEVEVELLRDDDAVVPESPASSMPTAQKLSTPPAPLGAPPPVARRPETGDVKTVTSPVNGLLLDIPVKVDQEVRENDVLCVLEAMKMKTNIASPYAGKIKAILVGVGDTIEAGKPIITFY
jgi:glutaconyl-CoA/methylmalonyl-CoA decarboxylase subunit gamma